MSSKDITSEKELEKRVWKLLEAYGLWQDWKKESRYWTNQVRDKFFRDFVNLAKQYKGE